MNTSKPAGIFVQINEKGQYIYKDPFIKGGFLISNDKYKKYKIYSSRYIIALLAALLVSSFISNIIASICVGLLTLIAGELLFRIKFIKSCTYLPDYHKNKDLSFFNSISKNTPTSKKIIKTVLYLILSILIIYNAYSSNYELYAVIFSWIIGISSFIISIIYFVATIKDGVKK